jgi:anaerobic carbon-monoxide dehydrogenase iron sulfur subunit
MAKQLKILSQKCTGCKSCELVCSYVNEKELNPSKSRIAAIAFLEGKYPLPYNFVSTCRQCADAPCLAVCPVGAIDRMQDLTKRVVVDRERCIGCGKCIDACPFGAMLFSRESKKVFKCELCDGNPACAMICPSGAIVFKEVRPFHAKAEDCQMAGFAVLSQRNRENVRSKKKWKQSD